MSAYFLPPKYYQIQHTRQISVRQRTGNYGNFIKPKIFTERLGREGEQPELGARIPPIHYEEGNNLIVFHHMIRFHHF